MEPFITSFKYILVGVDYVSKWVEAIELPNNEGKRSLIQFLKCYNFARFSTPRVIMR